MYEVYERMDHVHDIAIDDRLELDHLQREKGRFKAISQSGAEVRVFLDRGHTLQIGEILKSQCGQHITVIGAEEPVVTARCDDWEIFSRACYHLGNRHVKLQVGKKWLRITPDHVLEELLTGLGLSTQREVAVFLPESGAYSSSSHVHSHSH